jgi:hypothetical protein
MRPQHLFATIATCERIDAGVGVIWWSYSPRGRFLVHVLDYDLASMPSINGAWIAALLAHSDELIAKHRPVTPLCKAYVEPGGLVTVLELAMRAYKASADEQREPYTVVSPHDVERWPRSFDERARLVQPLVNSRKVVTIDSNRSFSFRAVRTNHLAAAIRDHRPGDPSSASELLHAFVLGMLLTQGGDKRETLPDTPAAPEEGLLARIASTLKRAVPAPRAQRPKGPPLAKIPLREGLHIVNGQPVRIEPRGPGAAQGWGYIELPVGGHIIDSVRHNVHDPRAGVTIEV